MRQDTGDALREERDLDIAKSPAPRIPRFTPWTVDDTVGAICSILLVLIIIGIAAGWFE